MAEIKGKQALKGNAKPVPCYLYNGDRVKGSRGNAESIFSSQSKRNATNELTGMVRKPN